MQTILTTISEYSRLAFLNILAYKMRSILTMLGIIIAITSLIVMLMLGESNKAKMMQEMQKIGLSTIKIYRESSGAKLPPPINEQIFNTLPFVEGSSLEYKSSQFLNIGKGDLFGEVTGIAPKYFDFMPLPEMLGGRTISNSEIENKSPVCMVDNITFDKYLKFAKTNTILVHGINFKIVGIFKSQYNPMYHVPTLYLPYSFAKNWSGVQWNIVLKFKNTDDMENKTNQLKNFLSLANREGSELKIMSSKDMIDVSERISKQFSFFIFGITFILLMVGGIGIMNIMLVSVTERTREIGIRRALGATINAIFCQFISETTLLCLIAGIIAVLIGTGIGYGLIIMFKYAIIIPIKPIFWGITISIFTGFASGLYPSLQAARKNPIQALKYE